MVEQMTVLLVDDEEIVLHVGRKMLEKLGFQVVTADSGGQALDSYRCSMSDIGIVILDMALPDCSGIQAYEQLRAIDPDVKVIVSSGYDRNGQIDQIMNMGCDAYIQKPFTFRQLSTKIHDVFKNGDRVGCMPGRFYNR